MSVSESALEAVAKPGAGESQYAPAGVRPEALAPARREPVSREPARHEPVWAAGRTRRWRTLRTLLRHRSGMVGLAGLLLVALVAAVGPRFVPYDPTAVDVLNKLQTPSAAHLLGTDYLGRDLLSRTVEGAHRSLGTAVIVVTAVIAVSLLFGSLAGFSGGLVDAVIMRVVDVKLGLPSLVLALALVGTLGPRLSTLMLALVVAQSPWYIRLIRSLVLRERERPYVLVARVHGAGAVAVVWRHVLPAVLGQLAVLATLDLGSVVLAVAGLSFLGLGVQPPLAEWGAMLNDGRITFSQRPLLMVVPGACIFFTVLSANLFGDALRDVLDPTWQGQR